MDRIGNIAGRMMEAWLLARAEALDAGCPCPAWRDPGREKKREPTEADPRRRAASFAPNAAWEEEMRGAAAATSGEGAPATAGDCPARAARGRRRWD